jgi:hypothetical protein
MYNTTDTDRTTVTATKKSRTNRTLSVRTETIETSRQGQVMIDDITVSQLFTHALHMHYTLAGRSGMYYTGTIRVKQLCAVVYVVFDFECCQAKPNEAEEFIATCPQTVEIE